MKTTLTLFSLLAITFSVAAQTKFGVFVLPGTDKEGAAKKINVAKKLGVAYVRDPIIVDKWDGSTKRYEAFIDAGFKVIPNINYGQPARNGKEFTPVPFPTDLAAYRKTLEAILDKYHPELIVIENEETNKNYHSGSIKDYLAELSVAIDVAHARGIKVADGGIHPQELCFFIYKEYLEKGQQKEAEDFLNRSLNGKMKTAIKSPGKNEKLDLHMKQADTLLNFFKTSAIDYVNIHYYEPVNKAENNLSVAADVLKAISDYTRKFTGKQLITNECGQKDNTNPSVVKQMLQEFAKNNYAYVIWFSGDGAGGAKALNDDDGNLRENGIAFKEFIQTTEKK